MADITLNVSEREETGTARARRLRMRGAIPCVVYGKGKKAIPVTLSMADIRGVKGWRFTENMLLNLVIKNRESAKKTVIVKEIQRDVIKGEYLHIDFNEISMTERLKTRVPVELTGDAVGVAEGGILEQLMHELEIECLPSDIPETIKIDITALAIGHSIYVRDIAVSAKISVLSDPDLPAVSVSAARVEEEAAETPDEGAETAEPEVISKGKKEEAGDAGEEKPKEKEK